MVDHSVRAAATDAGRPLRIGIVTDGLEERCADGQVNVANGGVGVYIYNLVKHLRLVDARNEYVLIRYGEGRLDIYLDGNSRSVILPRSVVARCARAFDVPHLRIATDMRLDVLHYPNQFGGAFLPRRVRRVVTVHDITPLLFPRHHPVTRVLGYRLLLRRSLRAADHVIVDSAHTAVDLVDRRLLPADKVTVIPLAAASMFTPTARTFDFRERYAVPERFILNVGVLEPRKNHALLVDALRRLHEAGEHIDLVIVGREGWRWRDPLAAHAVAHLRPRVHIYRNVPDADLVEFYNRAAVVAYPSLYEGFGLPVIEAMACGTPVVASSASCLPAVAGQAALLADPVDPADFADKLLAVLRDPSLRDRLVALGRRHAQEFSWRRTAAQTLAVYERVCGRVANGTGWRPPAAPG